MYVCCSTKITIYIARTCNCITGNNIATREMPWVFIMRNQVKLSGQVFSEQWTAFPLLHISVQLSNPLLTLPSMQCCVSANRGQCSLHYGAAPAQLGRNVDVKQSSVSSARQLSLPLHLRSTRLSFTFYVSYCTHHHIRKAITTTFCHVHRLSSPILLSSFVRLFVHPFHFSPLLYNDVIFFLKAGVLDNKYNFPRHEYKNTKKILFTHTLTIGYG